MEKNHMDVVLAFLKSLLYSPKFWTLVATLVSVAGSYYLRNLDLAAAQQAVIAALLAYFGIEIVVKAKAGLKYLLG